MPKTQTLPDNDYFDENDTEYNVAPRRESQRREDSRRNSSPKFITSEKIRKLRAIDKTTPFHIRINERRQKERRKSRPNLLSNHQIDMLRKK